MLTGLVFQDLECIFPGPSGLKVFSQVIHYHCPAFVSDLTFFPLHLAIPLLYSVFLMLLILVCHGEFLFWFCLFGVLEASCIWICISFSRFKNFSSVVLLKVYWSSYYGVLFLLGQDFRRHMLSWCPKTLPFTFMFLKLLFDIHWVIELFNCVSSSQLCFWSGLVIAETFHCEFNLSY